MRLSVWLVLFSMLILPAAGAGEARRPAGAVAFSGRVVDAHGRPAPGAVVYVSLSIEPVPGGDPPPRPVVSQTRAAADGAFRLTVPAPARKWSAAVVAVAAGQGPGGQDVRSPAEAAGLLIRLTHPSFLA